MDTFHEFAVVLMLVASARAQAPAPGGCAAPRYADEAAAAVAAAARMSPGRARAALGRLARTEGEEGLRGHPVRGALYALRARGLVPSRAVYCAEGSRPWVGVEADGGRLFRLPLGSQEDPAAVDLSRLEEARRPSAPSAGDPRKADALGAGAAAMAASLGFPGMAGLDPVSGAGLGLLRDALSGGAPVRLPAGRFEDACARGRCPRRSARATIDTDGYVADPALRALVRDAGFDRHHRDDTDFSYPGADPSDPARYLDSTRVPYVVRHRDSPWRVGDVVVIEHEGRRLAAFVGDSGRRRRVNEISFAAARGLGIDPHGNSGGTEEAITVTALSSVLVRPPQDERELLGALAQVQRWVDSGAR